MKPKAVKPNLHKTVLQVSNLVKKKEPKRLTEKKTVRFNLMTKSASEYQLLRSKSRESVQEKGYKLRSQSCLNISSSRIISEPGYNGPSTCLFKKSEPPCHTLLKSSKVNSLKKYFLSFSDLYYLGPIFNMNLNAPVKGILKTTKIPDQSNNSCGIYTSSKTSLTVKDSLLSLANKRDKEKHCCHSCCRVCAQAATAFAAVPNNGHGDITGNIPSNSIFSLAASIQKLHISAYPRGDEAGRDVTLTPGQHGFNFCQSQHLIGDFPQNGLQEKSSQAIMSFLDLEAGKRMPRFDVL